MGLAAGCDGVAWRRAEEPMVLDGERCEEQQYDGNAERRANSADHDTNYLLWTFGLRLP